MRALGIAWMLFAAPLALAEPPGLQSQLTGLDAAFATRNPAQIASRIAARFKHLVGTEENARLLVKALHEGTEVELTTAGVDKCDGAAAMRMALPALRLTWGEATTVLAIAQEQLTRVGLTHPSTPELQSVLLGGSVTGADGQRVPLKGLLKLRAEGAGWPQIAQASGTAIGPLTGLLQAARMTLD